MPWIHGNVRILHLAFRLHMNRLIRKFNQCVYHSRISRLPAIAVRPRAGADPRFFDGG